MPIDPKAALDAANETLQAKLREIDARLDGHNDSIESLYALSGEHEVRIASLEGAPAPEPGPDPVPDPDPVPVPEPGPDPVPDPTPLPIPEGVVVVGYASRTAGADSHPGGRTRTYHVTSLADDGPGSLREGLRQAGSHVVFDVAGTITLARDLEVRYPYLTIDAKTAPGAVNLDQNRYASRLRSNSDRKVHDIIVSGLRAFMLPGSNSFGVFEIDGGNSSYWGGDLPIVARVCYDHMSCHTSRDGIFDIYGSVDDVTIQNCLLYNNDNGMHSSHSGGLPRRGLTMARNVFARCHSRQPRLRHDTEGVDLVNNIVYGWAWAGPFEEHGMVWGWWGSGSGGDGAEIHWEAGDHGSGPQGNMRGCAYLHVNTTLYHGDGRDYPSRAIRYPGESHRGFYFENNLLPDEETEHETMGRSGPHPVPEYAVVPELPISDLRSILDTVGVPNRNATEQAVIDEIRAHPAWSL